MAEISLLYRVPDHPVIDEEPRAVDYDHTYAAGLFKLRAFQCILNRVGDRLLDENVFARACRKLRELEMQLVQ